MPRGGGRECHVEAGESATWRGARREKDHKRGIMSTQKRSLSPPHTHHGMAMVMPPHASAEAQDVVRARQLRGRLLAWPAGIAGGPTRQDWSRRWLDGDGFKILRVDGPEI